MSEHEPTPPPPPVIVVEPMSYAMPPLVARKSRWKLWVFGGLGGLATIAILCAVGFGWFLMSGKAEVEPVVEAFQTTIDAEDFSSAYGSIGSEWKSIQTYSAFESFERSVYDKLGRMTSKSVTSFNINTTTGGGNATISYNAIYTRGTGVVTYTLSKSSGQWAVIGHHVDSKSLLSLVTCKKCGTAQKTWGEFCSQCGAKIDR